MAHLFSGLWTAVAGRLSFGGRSDAAALVHEAEALRQLVDTAPAALVTLTREGTIATWNRAAERLFGWKQAEVEGRAPPYVPDESGLVEAALRQRVLAGNELFRRRVRFQARDGEALELLVSSAPQRGAGGAVIGMVSVFEELPPAAPAQPAHERARREPARTEPVGAPRGPVANMAAPAGSPQPGPPQPVPPLPAPPLPGPPQPAIAAPAAKPARNGAALEGPSRLLARVSHDLRQPLHALSLLTGALERRVKDPAVLDLVADAGTMVRSLQDSFDNVLDLARLEDGKVPANLVDASADEMIAPVIADIAREAARLGIIFRYVAPRATVQADPVLLQRLLRHLLVNALRFVQHPDHSPGLRRGKVLIGARRVGGQLRLIVADNGIGVPADKVDAIFEPFFQLDAGRAAGGLGLGLAIAQHLAQLQQSRVELRSQLGKGSVFSVDLRRAAPR